ncbi:MAG: hypothetical protein HWE18_03885 [Gammaproteobacteria bacterium]|nr:hypothetical protein [Gammaproteobacteria bacterium]
MQTIEDALQEPLFSNIEELGVHLLRNNQALDLNTAVELGLRCANLSQAFALAYRCALQTLLPSLDKTHWAAMCVTESQGNHPKQLQTYLDDNQQVFGHKSFVTMAGLAEQLILIVKQGDNPERPELKAMKVLTQQANVKVTKMPAMKMLQDVPHGTIELSGAVGEILEGDGHADFSKPFRTLEDAHVLVACSAMIMRQAKEAALPSDIMQKALGVIAIVKGMSAMTYPWQHLQLAEAFELFEALCNKFEEVLSACSQEFSQQWLLDKALFKIAGKARLARAEKAKQAIAEIMA